MFATLPSERSELLHHMLSAQLRGMAERRRDGMTIERLRVVVCSVCNAGPGDPGTRVCASTVANCGLIGRSHSSGDTL